MFFSARLPSELIGRTVSLSGGAALFAISLTGGIFMPLFRWLHPGVGIDIGAAALSIFLLILFVALKSKFSVVNATGLAVGCVLLAIARAVDDPATRISLGQFALIALGFLFVVRFFSAGPEPAGWNKKNVH